MNTEPHIVIDQTIIENNPIDLEIETLNCDGLTIKVDKHGITAYACLEWMIPSLVFAYISKPYFDGFLGEMGANHYNVLKNWIYKQNQKFKIFSTTTITASESTNKVSDSNMPNNFFAVYFKTPQGNRLKVFMPDCHSDEEDIKALSSILDDIQKMYSKPNGKFAKKINKLTQKKYEDLFAVYNKNTEKWEFYSSEMLIRASYIVSSF